MPKDTHPTLPADRAPLVLPEQVTIALAELAGAARDGLLALAVGTGLQVLHTLRDADVDRLVGPKGRHNAGLLLAATLAERLGIEQAADALIDLRLSRFP